MTSTGINYSSTSPAHALNQSLYPVLWNQPPFSSQCIIELLNVLDAGPRSAVGNVSGYGCVSDCRSRGRELDPGLVPYFRGD